MNRHANGVIHNSDVLSAAGENESEGQLNSKNRTSPVFGL